MKNIIHDINQLKARFLGKNLQEMSVLAEIYHEVLLSKHLKNTHIGKNLLVDIENLTEQKSTHLSTIKNDINREFDHAVFSLFDSPYFPELSIDGFFYQTISVPQALKGKIQSSATPVKMIVASKGFLSKNVVALFPENHIDHVQFPEDKVFYFIDKFVSRFFNITKPLLELMSPHQFLKLKNAGYAEIEYAASCWVHLHEHFHRQGTMPIANYLDVKGSKATAGLEELRVDILSILACVAEPHLFPEAAFVAEFILLERLMRYGVESPENLTYDAISSQFLFQYLLQHQGIALNDCCQIFIHQNIFLLLKKLADQIEMLELGIKVSEREHIKSSLKDFVTQYVNYNDKTKRFSFTEYFKWMRPGFLLVHPNVF